MPEKVLVDSDAFVGWIVATDAHHHRVTQAFERLKNEQALFVTTNLVIAETASLLSRRNAQSQAHAFLQAAQQIETLYITPQLHQRTVKLFLERDQQNTSFVDLANVVVAQAYDIQAILSFDKVYRRDFDLTLAA